MKNTRIQVIEKKQGSDIELDVRKELQLKKKKHVSPMGGPTVSVTLYPLSLMRLTISPWCKVLMST